MLASWRSLTKIAGSRAGSGSVRQRSGPADPCTTLLGFYTAQIYFEEWPVYGLVPLCVLCKFLCVSSSSLIYTVSRNSSGYACCTCNFVIWSSGLCLPAWILNIDDCLGSVCRLPFLYPPPYACLPVCLYLSVVCQYLSVVCRSFHLCFYLFCFCFYLSVPLPACIIPVRLSLFMCVFTCLSDALSCVSVWLCVHLPEGSGACI
jgi:hypothetical protein